ncbi:hypothetical protein GNF10_14010 [Nostoc sp. UCD121]|uniref:hypothetical protein n=1 Tax=unclassified Nostoc TaxID=2593658 RepID=UPI0016286EEE|nr:MULTISPECIES: hypothetical protein [unclassified Nostoc]MBC1223520.1 hypothetical protein [Nostoc sp. UCD120]MBC1277056.1 hypothetical protein [Nostoc sp. UCD121]MBC1294989.1 hypothetical protein [Nostoc sp. UCD122]
MNSLHTYIHYPHYLFAAIALLLRNTLDELQNSVLFQALSSQSATLAFLLVIYLGKVLTYF